MHAKTASTRTSACCQVIFFFSARCWIRSLLVMRVVLVPTTDDASEKAEWDLEVQSRSFARLSGLSVACGNRRDSWHKAPSPMRQLRPWCGRRVRGSGQRTDVGGG